VVGKRVLVTASSEGIGKGVAKRFLAEGAKVVITSRSEGKLKSTLDELRQISPEVYGITSDLTNRESLVKLVGFAKQVMGGVDVLILNVGNPPNEPSYFEDTSLNDWDYAVSLYLLSAVTLTKAVLNDMVRQRWGRVIYLSSWTVKEPQPQFVLADVSRAPLIQLAKILSHHYAQYNVTFNVVRMGSFRTPGALKGLEELAKRTGQSLDEVIRREVIERSDVRRFGDIENDLGSLLVYLASDLSSYLTGSVIDFDGGTSQCV
jgi:3-oxoacyl-[acyl-carrier protein] reductase